MRLGKAMASSGQRLRLILERRSMSAMAAGSSSAGFTSMTPAFAMRVITSRPSSVRTTVKVQSLNLPIPPVEMSACSAAKSGH